MRLNIRHDANASTSTIVEDESGNPLQGVDGITFSHFVPTGPLAEISFSVLSLSATGVPCTPRMQHPIEGDLRRVRRIEFADGSIWEDSAA